MKKRKQINLTQFDPYFLYGYKKYINALYVDLFEILVDDIKLEIEYLLYNKITKALKFGLKTFN